MQFDRFESEMLFGTLMAIVVLLVFVVMLLVETWQMMVERPSHITVVWPDAGRATTGN